MKYPNNPEIVVTVDMIDGDGDEVNMGDRIAGVQVRQSKSERDGIVDLDIRGFKGSKNLVVRIPLPELIAALSCATMNAERDVD